MTKTQDTINGKRLKTIMWIVAIAAPLLLGAAGKFIHISTRNSTMIENIVDKNKLYSQMYVILSSYIAKTDEYKTANDKDKERLEQEIAHCKSELNRHLKYHLSFIEDNTTRVCSKDNQKMIFK